MITSGISKDSFLIHLEAALRTVYTQEQRDFILRFGTGPTFCFANPGTGKTFTAVGGLLTAELFEQIPGENIYALSFTRLATGELAVRHKSACNKLGISQTVTFKTLHALCREILLENYTLLGLSSFNTTAPMRMEDAISLIQGSCEEWGIGIKLESIRACFRACSSLNAALIFDEDNVRSKMAFKECHVEYEVFERIRGLLFSYNLLANKISISDLLLYTVMLMNNHPEVSQKFKSKCKLMLVDEAQDLSLLQLRVISMLTDNPVVIGDMKQQIYAFNGACQEVVQAYSRLYPNYVSLKLTKSFRCKNEIARYATRIIIPNEVGGEDYQGVGDGGLVTVHEGLYENGMDVVALSERLHAEYIQNNRNFPKEYLFLTRNNISLIPIIEELYKQKLPFRANRYTPAYEVPVISDLCELLALCDQPLQANKVGALKYLIPEMTEYQKVAESPFYKIMMKTGCSVFEVNYQFRDIGQGATAMQLLTEVQEMMHKGATTGEMFNKLWPMYENIYLNKNKWKLDSKPDYYISSVKALTRKPYARFVMDEIDKLDIIKKSEQRGIGIRCYTMHASKGLEADVVYIIDADEGLIPNISKLNKMIRAECDMDAARVIREERSLCYVACTRARDELHIVHNGQPAFMLLGINEFEQYDKVYKYYSNEGDDISAFESFVRRYVDEYITT